MYSQVLNTTLVIVFHHLKSVFRVDDPLPREILIQPKPVSQPKFKKFPNTHAPFEVFSKLYKRAEHAYILESIEGPKKLARFSFIGFDPDVVIRVKNGETEIQNTRFGERTRTKVSDPLLVIKEIVGASQNTSQEFRLIGGAVGYLSYDAIRYWEKLPEAASDDSAFPELEMGIFDDGIVFDHEKNQTFYYYRNDDRFDEVKRMMIENGDFETLHHTEPEVSFSKECFEKAVENSKEYITRGDIFQVVLSKRYEFEVRGDLRAFYRSLRNLNPSPYMYFLKMGGRQIIGSSPEMLARVDRRTIETFPIAGTRPCVENVDKNRALQKDLLSDPKERAEHVMLVDLARNDVGKVSEFGSVHVPEFMTIHQYSHVQHIVSRVVGELKNNCDCYDALRAVFPAGTVSGAPKVRAMEIIEESEPFRRGPYAGALGYFSFNGNADFAITIRTLVVNGSKAYIQAGAGIVADSVPEREWFETEHKAGALMRALEMSGENRHESTCH